MKNHPSKRTVIILISLLAILVIFGVYFGIRQLNLNSAKPNIVEIPPIQTYLKSESKDRMHKLDVTFSLEVTKLKNKDITKEALHDKIKFIISDLDYDLVSGQGGTNYLKEEIAKNLGDYVEPGNLKGIYITNVVSEANLQQDAPANSTTDRSSEVFKGLFKGTK